MTLRPGAVLLLAGLAVLSSRVQAQQRAVTLADAIRLSERVQPLVVRAAGDLETAAAQRRSAWGAYLPSLTASSSASSFFSEGTSRIDPVTGQLLSGNSSNRSLSTSLSASVDLFTGFRRGAEGRAARASQTAAEASFVDARFQQALETTGATPRIVTDNGSQFTSAEFKDLVRRFSIEHIRIRTYHPESNGTVERFHRTTREALAEAELANLTRAREIIAAWVRHYNEDRLHAGIGYLPPAEYYRGNPAARQLARSEKLARARDARRKENQARLTAAA